MGCHHSISAYLIDSDKHFRRFPASRWLSSQFDRLAQIGLDKPSTGFPLMRWLASPRWQASRSHILPIHILEKHVHRFNMIQVILIHVLDCIFQLIECLLNPY